MLNPTICERVTKEKRCTSKLFGYFFCRNTYFEGHYTTRLSLQDVQTFQSSRIILRISRRSENLSLRCCTKDSATSLRFRFPRSAESLSLHGGICAEFDDHEIRGGYEQFVAQLLLARERRKIHGLLFRSTTDQNLHYVEALLRFEFLKLESTKIRIDINIQNPRIFRFV